MKKIEVRTKKELQETVQEYRTNGWNIITFGKNLIEMEKDDNIIIIEKTGRASR